MKEVKVTEEKLEEYKDLAKDSSSLHKALNTTF